MAYGAKVILPTDLKYGAPRVKEYTDERNEPSLQDALDQLDEACDVALHGWHDTNIHYEGITSDTYEKDSGGGKSCALIGTKQQRSSHVVSNLGGAIHNWRSTMAGHLQLEG